MPGSNGKMIENRSNRFHLANRMGNRFGEFLIIGRLPHNASYN